MRIFFYLADITFTGGIEKITTTLSNYFVQQGIEVCIVSNFRTNQTYAYKLDERVNTVFLSEFPYSGKPGSIERLKLFLSIRKQVKKFFKAVHNEIVIVQTFPNAFLYFLAMGKKNRNKIITVEHVHYFYYGRLIRILRYFVYKYYNNVCVLTNADKRQYDKWGIHATVIPNAVDSFPSKIPVLSERKNILLGVGRLEEQKNFRSLIDVFFKVHQKYPEWKLHIYGRGTLHDKLEKQICDLHLSECAKLMGVSDSIGTVFKEAGVFVLTSLYEGFSMVIAEAMANGIPVVSYDCPNGPADLIKNEENGLLVENQNEEELYKSICRMIDDSALRQNCSESALNTVQKYDIQHVFKQWKTLFDKTGAER
ncbi:MAG: glycosyltransferase family 4 protein [Treponemataceae bacterium]|nr:glycosyltransferase family 4 protein [Treponemataceae bacterium]